MNYILVIAFILLIPIGILMVNLQHCTNMIRQNFQNNINDYYLPKTIALVILIIIVVKVMDVHEIVKSWIDKNDSIDR